MTCSRLFTIAGIESGRPMSSIVERRSIARCQVNSASVAGANPSQIMCKRPGYTTMTD